MRRCRWFRGGAYRGADAEDVLTLHSFGEIIEKFSILELRIYFQYFFKLQDQCDME